jgi:hypothetical protein
VSQSWSIVNGTERDPNGDAEADFNPRRNLAIQIIFSSVSQDYVHTIAPFLDIFDPKGMWDKLKTFDQGRDSVFIANIRAQFAKEIFDPTTQTVRQFKRILDHYRNQIASTASPITDEEAKNKLLQALPSGMGSDGWKTIRLWCVKEKLNYEGCINAIEAFDRPPALPEGSVRRNEPSASKATHITKHSCPGSCLQNRYDTQSRSITKRRRSPSPSPTESSNSNSSESSSLSSIGRTSGQCFFCGEKGHIQDNCVHYLKSQRQIRKQKRRAKRSKRKKSKGKGKAKEEPKKSARLTSTSGIAPADRRSWSPPSL